MMKTQALSGLPEGAEVLLPAGSSIVLERSCGGRLALLAGRVWLTEPGRPGDVILRGGQRWQIGSDDRVVLTAWESSRLVIGGEAVAVPG
jgi:hypothetical protein